MPSLPNTERQNSGRKAPSRWVGQPGSWRIQRDAEREAAEEDDASSKGAVRETWASLLRQLRSILDEVAASTGIAYSSSLESYYQDLRRLMLRSLGETSARDDAASIYPEVLAAVAGIGHDKWVWWTDFGQQLAIRFENAIDDIFVKSSEASDSDMRPCADDSGSSVSSPARGPGRPRGSTKRSREAYRDYFLDLKGHLHREPKEAEFLRFLNFIEQCEAQGKRPTPHETLQCVNDPDAKKFARGTLASNLKPDYWPWAVFVTWATSSNGEAT